MKWLFPKTLFGQILLALFTGLLAAQAVGVWLMLDERAKLGDRLLGGYAAQRIAGMISLLDAAGPAERIRLVRALTVPPTRITLQEPWQIITIDRSKDANEFLGSITQELERPIHLQVLSINRADGQHELFHHREIHEAPNRIATEEMHLPFPSPPDMAMRRRPPTRPILFVVGQAQLSDGTIATFRHALPQQNVDWPARLLGLLVVLGLSVTVLAGWAVRRLTRPLAIMADAASGLAANLDQSPLPESGPLEVVRAAQAFNKMQRDLKCYLDTRAQALAAVSHDLRLPITRLLLRIERLSDSELKSKIESDLSEMDEMIGNTLNFLRADSKSENPVQLDLNALLESVSEDMRTLGISIEITGDVSAPVMVRPQSLRRCLANLLDNARRYGGKECIQLSVKDDDGIEIRVEDRGLGIPDSELEKVFEPYVRLEASRAKHSGGTGLGLAIARAIARSHGGDVRLEARDGGGLSAILTLPH